MLTSGLPIDTTLPALREALARRPPRTSHERFTDLVRKGWINARGQVTRLLGGTADPEPNYQTWTGNGQRKASRKGAG